MLEITGHEERSGMYVNRKGTLCDTHLRRQIKAIQDAEIFLWYNQETGKNELWLRCEYLCRGGWTVQTNDKIRP